MACAQGIPFDDSPSDADSSDEAQQDAAVVEPSDAAETPDATTIDAASAPPRVALQPADLLVARGQQVELGVVLDVPAPPGGLVVALRSDAGDALTLPSSVTVSAGATNGGGRRREPWWPLHDHREHRR